MYISINPFILGFPFTQNASQQESQIGEVLNCKTVGWWIFSEKNKWSEVVSILHAENKFGELRITNITQYQYQTLSLSLSVHLGRFSWH